jgi:prolyl oligopeptidase
MLTIDRRRLLAGTGGTLVAALVANIARAAVADAPPAPVARVAVVKDTYFGDTLSDPYRWMENSKDPDWLPYLKGQNNHARAILDAIPGRGALMKRIEQVSGDVSLTSHVQRAGGKLFYQQRPSGADNYKLFVREDGHDRVLVDPTALGGATGHVSLDWWSASPSGSHVVYGLSRDGSEDSLLHVMTAADGRDLPDRIPNTEAANPQWLDDDSGFFYNQLTGAVATPDRYLDSLARFHRLGTDPANDPILMKRGLTPDVAYDRIQSPYIATFRGAAHVILSLSDIRPETRLYIAPLADAVAGRAHWTEVATFEDEITGAELDGDALFLISEKGTPRGRILLTSAKTPSLASAVVAVAQGPMVIEDMSHARDGLYLKMMDGGVSRLRRLGGGGHVADIALPFDGTIGAVFANPGEDGVLMTYTGWLTPSGVWSVDGATGTVADTGVNPRPQIDVSAYETVHGFATARDGVKVPFSLIYKKGLTRDGSTPAWISAYGSYGSAAYTPSFAGRTLALIDAGFIVGYANVRGGGEYGREWHKAGQLANKPNTWRDLIDVCEHLCAEKYTAPQRLAIGGRSAGGITMGRAMTERPDLFAAVIDGVGWSNPLRYVVEQDGAGEEPEWGAIADPDGYKALKSIDSYQHVVDRTPYPAVLLTTGVTDPRVAPFHVAKMTARLQAATSSGKPILLRVDYDAGHGIGSTRGQQDREAADTYAFLLWRTGVAGYKPV